MTHGLINTEGRAFEDTQREDSHMTRLMHLSAKEHRGLLANTISLRRQGRVIPESHQRKKSPTGMLTSDLEPLELWDNAFLF